MEGMLNAALVGTGRQASPAPASDVPTEQLAARLPASSPERHLLLRAGAWGAYRLAGHTALAMAPAPEPAPPETQRTCSPRAAQLIVDLLAGAHADLLPEALTRLRRAGQIMPPEQLLPLLAGDPARNASPQPVRALLVAALGERGRWLARQNEDWRWVLETTAEGMGLPPDADAIWQEGSAARRRAVFAQVRQADPARARDWLASAWQREKLDMRLDLIHLLEPGLAAEDEPFLTQALEDKSDRVRILVARLLARLPQSPLASRMRARAAALLDYAGGALQVMAPKTLDPAWQRDGIAAEPPRGTSKRAWWLDQVVAAVSPEHWQERFGATPAALIAAAERTEYAAALIEGWSWAALAHQRDEWIVPLWQWWLVATLPATPGGAAVRDLRDQLGTRLPAEVAEERLAHIMSDPAAPAYESWDGLLAALPAPWSASFGAHFLAALRAAVATLAQPRADDAQWLPAIATAGTALPEACFAAALAEWTIPEPEVDEKGRPRPHHRYNLYQWRTHLERLTEALRIRQTLYAEIHLEEQPA